MEDPSLSPTRDSHIARIRYNLHLYWLFSHRPCAWRRETTRLPQSLPNFAFHILICATLPSNQPYTLLLTNSIWFFQNSSESVPRGVLLLQQGSGASKQSVRSQLPEWTRSLSAEKPASYSLPLPTATLCSCRPWQAAATVPVAEFLSPA